MFTVDFNKQTRLPSPASPPTFQLHKKVNPARQTFRVLTVNPTSLGISFKNLKSLAAIVKDSSRHSARLWQVFRITIFSICTFISDLSSTGVSAKLRETLAENEV